MYPLVRLLLAIMVVSVALCHPSESSRTEEALVQRAVKQEVEVTAPGQKALREAASAGRLEALEAPSTLLALLAASVFPSLPGADGRPAQELFSRVERRTEPAQHQPQISRNMQVVGVLGAAEPHLRPGLTMGAILLRVVRDARCGVAKLLLTLKVQVEAEDLRKALELAVEGGNEQCVHALVLHVINRTELAQHVLQTTHNVHVVRALGTAAPHLLRGPTMGAIFTQAVRDGRCGVAEALLALKVQLEAEGVRKALELAVEGGNVQCDRALCRVMDHF